MRKKILLITIVAASIVSCRKNIEQVSKYSEYLHNVSKELKDSLADNDFSSVDFSRAIITNSDTGKSFLRIPYKGKKISEEFILLMTDKKGNISKGEIIGLKQNLEGKKFTYNGVVKISSLNRASVITSDIIDGYISIFHSRRTNPTAYYEEPMMEGELPDVIVTCYISSVGSSSSNYAFLYGFFGDDSEGDSGYYSSMDDGDSASSNGSNGSENDNIEEDSPILVDVEPSQDLPPLDVQKALKCFSNVPDNGSTCSIEILCDIPVDKDPTKLFNWSTGSPGHTFLQIKKTNGGQSVMKNIGFYPASGWKTMLTTAPVPGKFVDNSEHEFNAGLTMNLTPDQLKNDLAEISYLANFVKYDIDDYNCTDFALEVFNVSRPTNPLEIPKYDIPGGMAPNGTSTPQGLYNRLQSMQQSNVESANINIPGVKGWVADSDAPCN